MTSFFAAAAVLGIQVSGSAAVTLDPAPTIEPPAAVAPLALVLTDQEIEQAIRETLAKTRAAEPARRCEADTPRANRPTSGRSRSWAPMPWRSWCWPKWVASASRLKGTAD